MRNKFLRSVWRSLCLLAVVALPAHAGSINILWYTGGVQSCVNDYRASFNALAATNPGGNSWNITYWDAGTMPTGTFNVLVTASQEGGWCPAPNYTALMTAGLTESSFGDRVMLTGQDADWHYLNHPGDGTTSQAFNGPRGFLTDAINWAGSGTGMGGVILSADLFTDATFTGQGARSSLTNENVLIPSDFAGFPINAGLTTAGLSNWGNSSHDVYAGTDLSKWTPINADGGTCTGTTSASCSEFVTLVSAATAGAPTTTPEPATLTLLATGLVGLGGFGGRRRRNVRS